MDTLKDHFSSSIWWNKVKEKWNPAFSWMGKKFLGVMVLDPWHIAKTAMLFLIFIGFVVPSQFKWWEYFTLYIAWGIGFNAGYEYLFKRK
jgi:hypothetical protein